MLEGWARDGLTDEQIASNIGISTGWLYEWKKSYPEIAEAIKKGKAPVDIQVENALLKRALGYDYEEVTTEITTDKNGRERKHIRKTKKHVSPDPASIIFWLKNRKAKQWKDKPEAPIDDDSLNKVRELLACVESAIK